jgi:hypothetical protein
MSANGHKTQVTVAIIGLIGVLGAAVLGSWDRIFPRRPADRSDQSTAGPPAPAGAASGGSGRQGAAASECLQTYFLPVPQDRIATLEVGAKDRPIIEPHQPQDQTVAIRLEQDGRLIGGLKVRFYPNNALFKIESVVDSSCRPIEDYANATRGGDKHILQNWDDLQVRLGSSTYTVSVDYGSGRIDADFVRVTPGA